MVYLFGVLHKSFGFKIESIQSGYPDCVARRRAGRHKWEEVRIEFEFNSRAFQTHAHDPAGVDVIVCWRHDWKDCPPAIEVIELRTILKDMEKIDTSFENRGELSGWQRFCQQKRLEGLDFSQIARLWQEQKKKQSQLPPAR
ncbi:MAG: hypothetical protein AB1640_09535 [bacterium]